MKKITLATVMMFLATALTAQPNIISTSFYSEALDETKMVNVFLPPGYDANPDLHYPVIYYLHGWQGSQNEGNGVMNTAYTMINQGLIDPVIIVCAHNSPPPFGGSVYTNSILWGNYETYMVEDLCNWIEATYRAMPGKHYRAVFGMSMGGYGAFRYGILHRDQYCALASCAAPVSFLEDYMCMQFRQMILQANQGPPYFYNYATGGMYTQIYFLYYGAFAPNYNTPQTYINPAILEFPLDENGNYIDTILAKVIPHDIASLINQLTPESSPGIYFGCGTNDPFFLYPGNMDVKDSLDLYGIPYTFYSHGGGHTMPAEFTQNAFMFLDSLLMPPVIPCSCLPEGISFNTQAEIDNFQTNYPGCREIGGDVNITGVESDISNLQGLSILSEIGGLLWINTTYDLANLEGLNGIVSIGGDLVIGNASMGGSGNHILEDFSGLNNLETIGGDFSVSFNPILINFQGLSSLVTVGGDFRVGYNPSLINFEGVESLISIGEDLILGSNESMTNLTGLDNLSSIGGEIRIYGNSALNVCETEWLCAYLDSPTGAVNIHDNAAGCNSVIEVAITCGAIPCLPYGNYLINSQSDIDNFQVAFPDCEELQGNVRVSGNDITDLSGLNNVTFIGGDLWIIYNNALTSLTGLDNLTSIGGNLSISGNESLSTCDAEWLCDLLSNTGGYVNIYNNATGCSSVIEVALSCGGLPCLLHGGYGFYTQADIDNFSLAFPGCSDLEGSVGIKGNDITNLDGLNQVTSIGGNLRFYNAYELQSLMGLGNLASIGGYLEFWQNNSLTSLAGLENLISVGSYLMLWHYDALTSLTGLEGLTSIAGSLEIIFNSSLTNLTGLENIVASSISDLKISSNTSLSTCHVQSICDYLAAPNGTVTINWNAPGCNSQAQVIAACETVDIEETALESALSVYPNPLSDQMNITLALDKPNPVSLIMTNNLGQIVAFINENQYSAGTHQIFWNASKLPSGIYFLRLQIGDGVVIKKILKY